MKKSAATKRCDNYPAGGGQWFCGFSYTEAKGLGYEEGVHRRDPSSVIYVDGLYYVWYTKSTGPYFGHNAGRDTRSKVFPWDFSDLWYATSPDGVHWTEQGCAVHRGKPGEYDDRTVCTPDVLAHDGKYYLVYQALTEPKEGYGGSEENVGMSVADNPNGPWRKTGKTILEKMAGGFWFGEGEESYNSGDFHGTTHDPMLLFYKNKFYLYYKCGGTGMYDLKFCGKDTRWGVAIADHIEGPYTHSEFNPVTNSGHETMLWNYDGGIAALLNRDGPEKDTIQYAKDGINFELMAKVQDTPQAGGAFRSAYTDESPLEGIRWGLCHTDERNSQWNYILRFDLDLRHPYRIAHTYPKFNNVFFD